MNKMPLLITGLNGLIGWHCFEMARARGLSVWGTYRRRHRTFSGARYLRVDLDHAESIREMLEKVQPSHIIHARSICDLDVCEQEPELTQRINVEGTRLLLEEAERIGTVEQFCYLSTDHVFDGQMGAYVETDEPIPKHVYGRSKLDAESLVSKSKLSSIIVRPGLAIGASVQGNKGPQDWVFSRLKVGKPTHLFTDEWRTPIYVEALAREILDLLEAGRSGIFHIAGNLRVNRYELALSLARRAGLATEHIFSRTRAEDRWAAIRPKDLSLKSLHLTPGIFSLT